MGQDVNDDTDPSIASQKPVGSASKLNIPQNQWYTTAIAILTDCVSYILFL